MLKPSAQTDAEQAWAWADRCERLGEELLTRTLRAVLRVTADGLARAE